MAQIGSSGVSLRGTYLTEAGFTLKVSGTVVQADIGKAVSQDTTAANTVKLAADGDTIVGQLTVYEKRLVEGVNVGTILPANTLNPMFFVYTGTDPAVGDSVVGGGAGLVKKSGTAIVGNRVWEVDTVAKTVVVTLPA